MGYFTTRGRPNKKRVVTSSGSASPLNSPSTVTYVPRAHPFTLGSTIELPREFLSTARVSRSFVRETTITEQGSPTANMAALNSEIQTCALIDGDTRIILPLGMVFQGTMWLEPHLFSSRWTYIEAATAPCAEGTRTSPVLMASAPHLHCVGHDTTTIRCRPSANNYRVMGVKCTCELSVSTQNIYYVVRIHAGIESQNDENVQTTLASCPANIILDRILVFGDSGLPEGRAQNGVSLNGIRLALVDSYITGQWNDGAESHGMLFFNGPGPYKIVNNYCDSGSICVLFGGTGSALGSETGRPKDIEFRRNYLAHPPAWCPADGVASTKYGLKGLFELKNAERVLCEGNFMERCPVGAQTGMSMVIKSAGDGMGPSTGMGTSHATVRYNIIRNTHTALSINGVGDPIESGVIQLHDVAVYHNLWYDVGIVHFPDNSVSGISTSAGTMLSFLNATTNLKIRNNTFVANTVNNAGFAISDAVSPEGASTGFDVADNVGTSCNTSITFFYSGGFNGVAGLNKYGTGWTWVRNFICGFEGQYSATLPQGNGNLYPDAGVAPTLADVLDDVKFVDATNHNYRLSSLSPGKLIGLGGTDPGCNHDDLELATSGVSV